MTTNKRGQYLSIVAGVPMGMINNAIKDLRDQYNLYTANDSSNFETSLTFQKLDNYLETLESERFNFVFKLKEVFDKRNIRKRAKTS